MRFDDTEDNTSVGTRKVKCRLINANTINKTASRQFAAENCISYNAYLLRVDKSTDFIIRDCLQCFPLFGPKSSEVGSYHVNPAM